MSNDRKKTRTASEETQLRELVAALTDHVLEMKEDQRKNNVVLKARLDGMDSELTASRKANEETSKALASLSSVVGEISSRTNDLHSKLLGESNRLGQRIYDLEKERKRGRARTSRPPGRG